MKYAWSCATGFVVFVVFVALLAGVVQSQKTIATRNAQIGIEPHKTDVFIIRDLLGAPEFEVVQRDLHRKRGEFVRKNTWLRSGEALALSSLKDTSLLRIFRSSGVLKRIFDHTGMQLQLVPRTDPNQISALRYAAVGDGIDTHKDGNIYMGTRWAAIYVVTDDQNAQIEVDGKNVELPPNTLLLFKGDKVDHRVHRRTEEGERMVVSMLFCDVCMPYTDPFTSLWSFCVRRSFY